MTALTNFINTQGKKTKEEEKVIPSFRLEREHKRTSLPPMLNMCVDVLSSTC